MAISVYGGCVMGSDHHCPYLLLGGDEGELSSPGESAVISKIRGLSPITRSLILFRGVIPIWISSHKLYSLDLHNKTLTNISRIISIISALAKPNPYRSPFIYFGDSHTFPYASKNAFSLGHRQILSQPFTQTKNSNNITNSVFMCHRVHTFNTRRCTAHLSVQCTHRRHASENYRCQARIKFRRMEVPCPARSYLGLRRPISPSGTTSAR